MEKEEIKIKISKLKIKLIDKFDKCQWSKICTWNKTPNSSSDVYKLSFDGIGKIFISRHSFLVYNKYDSLISENNPMEEEKQEAENHSILYSMIIEKYKTDKDDHLSLLIKELDNCK